MKVRIFSAFLASALFAAAGAAGAQTCRTSLSTGMILCDNGATARTSPVAGTTTFTDGRTARTDPVTGTTRFADGTSFTSVKVETQTRAAPAATGTVAVPVEAKEEPTKKQPNQRRDKTESNPD